VRNAVTDFSCVMNRKDFLVFLLKNWKVRKMRIDVDARWNRARNELAT
jgi:hypothetical protein